MIDALCLFIERGRRVFSSLSRFRRTATRSLTSTTYILLFSISLSLFILLSASTYRSILLATIVRVLSCVLSHRAVILCPFVPVFLDVYLLFVATSLTSNMRTTCVVGGCSCESGRAYLFPKKTDPRYHVWVRYVATTRSDFSASSHKNPRMCRKHFTQKQFENLVQHEMGFSRE